MRGLVYLLQQPAALKIAGLLLLLLGVICFGSLLQDKEFLPVRLWNRYTLYLDRLLRFLFLPASGRKIALTQLGGVALLLAATVVVDVPYWYAMVAVIAAAPAVWLERAKRQRVELLEQQVDGFILALANALKTVPSAGAALQSVVPVLRDPTRQEIDRVLKEMRVGATLEQAILNMAARIGSRSLDAALSAVIIGIQVGGNLPVVLETTAATIREMNRLEGVVRTKTAEGKAQLWVLVAFPFGIVWAFSLVNPGYFDPLQKSFGGSVVIAAAVTFWLAAILLARKVLAVDI